MVNKNEGTNFIKRFYNKCKNNSEILTPEGKLINQHRQRHTKSNTNYLELQIKHIKANKRQIKSKVLKMKTKEFV